MFCLFSCSYCLSGLVIAIVTFALYKLLKGKPQLVKPTRNQAVFITGCDSGFGREAALKLHNFGYTVFAGCLNAEEAKANTFSTFSNIDTFKVVQIDVTKDEQVAAAFAEVKQWLDESSARKLASVVNNAGTGVYGPIEWVPMRYLDLVNQVNLYGVIRVSKQALPLMRKGGRIVVLASVAGEMNGPNGGLYCVSKAAVLSLLDCMRPETYHMGVTYSAICPDFYLTGLTNGQTAVDNFKRMVVDGIDPEVYEAYGGDRKVAKISQTVGVEIPKWAKKDISPVINCILDAVASEKPQRTYYPIDKMTRVLRFLRFYAPSLADKIYYNRQKP